MGLNTGQVTATNGILKEMFEGEHYGATLIGEGGTGKTFCTTFIIEQLLKYDLKVLLAAPTNKAVKQLEKACRAAGLPMDKLTFKTIHSALGLALMPSSERKFVTQTKEEIVSEMDVIVLDEGSMLNKILLQEYLLPALERSEVFCLILGDDMQLPPVNEQKSLAFELFPTWELTKNERQRPNADGTENTINVVARQLRGAIKGGEKFNFRRESDQNIKVVKSALFMRAVVDAFDMDTDLEEQRVIAWRNDRVRAINKAIREKLYGPDAWKFVVGERVVTASPLQSGRETVLSTDEECIVSDIRESQLFEEETGEYWSTVCLVLKPVYADVKQAFAHIVADHEMERYNARLRDLEQKAMAAKGTAAHGMRWRMYWTFKELFADITHCYCITAHRSQGSSYSRVFLDVNDMLDNPRGPERKKLIYVGWSRARHELTVNRLSFST